MSIKFDGKEQDISVVQQFLSYMQRSLGLNLYMLRYFILSKLLCYTDFSGRCFKLNKHTLWQNDTATLVKVTGALDEEDYLASSVFGSGLCSTGNIMIWF